MSELLSEFEATVDQVNYKNGDLVNAGDLVLTLNCMKMIMEIFAPRDGRITYYVDVSDYIQEGQPLAKVE